MSPVGVQPGAVRVIELVSVTELAADFDGGHVGTGVIALRQRSIRLEIQLSA